MFLAPDCNLLCKLHTRGLTVVCTLHVTLVRRKGNFMIDTVAIGAEWMEN